MVDSSVRFQPATLPEAARTLGVSESTVRRLVKAGKLEAERVPRPQGHVWMVRVPAPSSDPPRWIPPSPANPLDQPSPPAALQTWLTSVLEPLVLELGTSRQRIEDLARENGRESAELERAASTVVALSNENEALRASQAKQDANLRAGAQIRHHERPVPLLARLRAQAPWLALTLAVLALVAVVVLLGWLW